MNADNGEVDVRGTMTQRVGHFICFVVEVVTPGLARVSHSRQSSLEHDRTIAAQAPSPFRFSNRSQTNNLVLPHILKFSTHP